MDFGSCSGEGQGDEKTMTWIQSFGSKYHYANSIDTSTGYATAICGIYLMKDPVDEPPENKKCKKCLKKLKETKP